MRNLFFPLVGWIVTAGAASAQIIGPATVDPDVNNVYHCNPQNLDGNAAVTWTVGPGAVIVSQNTFSCTIKATRQYVTTCGIPLTIAYSVISNNSSFATSQTLSLGRYAFMTGPQTVQAGQSCTYIVCDPCHSPFFPTYNWSSTVGEANPAAVNTWHYNNASVQWPTAVPPGALATGIIGRVRCTVSGSGYSAMTSDYPVKIALPGQGAIVGPHSAPKYSHAPLTYTTTPLPGMPTNCTYQWTLPTGWTGTSSSNTIIVIPNGSSAGVISVRGYMSNAIVGPYSTTTITVGPPIDISKKIESVHPKSG